MAVMTAAQTAAELQRKKNAGITPTSTPTPTPTNPYTNPYSGAGVQGNAYTAPTPSTPTPVTPVVQPTPAPPARAPYPNQPTDYHILPDKVADKGAGIGSTSDPSGMVGGFTYGTDPAKSSALVQNVATWQNDADKKNAEIQRALGVRDDLKSKGLDYSAQDKHLYQTLNYKDPVDATIPDETPAPDDYSWITDMVNNELANQKTTIEQELARMQQANDLSVTQNNNFLSDSIKRLEDNRIKAGAEIVNFQNRRGGFYSGGVDYQTASNNEVFAEQEGSVTKDIGARNADIWSRNRLLAEQAATNLAALQNQAPARIQQLIAEQMEKDRKMAIDEAGITGMWNGQQTMDMQKQTFDQNLATNKQALDETQVIAKLTGFLPNGQPTNEYQQTILENAWKVIGQIGYVPNELASVVGVKAGTKTLDAQQVAIQKQNANTSSANSALSRTKFDNEQNLNAEQAKIMDGIAQFDTAAEASAWLNLNASRITASLGSKVYEEMKQMLPLFFGVDTSAADAKAKANAEKTKTEDAKKLRSEAVDLAVKDNRWKFPTQDKEALIQEYIAILGGK